MGLFFNRNTIVLTGAKILELFEAEGNCGQELV